MTPSSKLKHRILPTGVFASLLVVLAIAPYTVAAKPTTMNVRMARQIIERARVNKMNFTRENFNFYVSQSRAMHLAGLQHEERELLEICCNTRYVNPGRACSSKVPFQATF